MKRASTYFTADERERIRAAVASAEARTSGEIVPVLATESGDYDREEHIAGFLFALLVLSTVWTNAQGVAVADGWSATPHSVKLGLLPVLALLTVSYAVGTGMAARLTFLRALLVGPALLERNADEAAARAFHMNRLASTKGATGVMIYVSLFERRVRVIADDAVAGKIADTDWQAVRDLILAGFRDGNPADAFCAAIEKCGDLLAPHFPRRADDANELPDGLVIVERNS